MAEASNIYGVMTSRGRLVRKDVLEDYALKAPGAEGEGEESRQIKDQFASLYGQENVARPTYNPQTLIRLLDLNTYHMRACQTKAHDTVGHGWNLQPAPGVDDPSEEQAEAIRAELSGSPGTELITELRRACYDYEAVGWGAAEITRQAYEPDGAITAIRHVPSHTVRIDHSEKRVLQIRQGRRVWFRAAGVTDKRYLDWKTGQWSDDLSVGRRASEILMWNNHTPRNDYYGASDVMPALGAIHGDLSRRDYNIAFFENYGIPSFAVFVTGDFDPGDVGSDGKNDVDRKIESFFSQINENPHSALVMSIPTREDAGTIEESGNIDVEFKPLSTEQKEASFRMYRQDNRDEVLAAHAVPPYRAGIAQEGALGGSTAREATEVYRESVVTPRQNRLENLVNELLLADYDQWVWKLETLDTSDEAHDLDVLRGLFEMGAVTPREVTAYLGERFGATVSDDDPPPDWRYLGGTPLVGPGVPATTLGDLVSGGIITPNEARAWLGLEAVNDELASSLASASAGGEEAALLHAVKETADDVARKAAAVLDEGWWDRLAGQTFR